MSPRDDERRDCAYCGWPAAGKDDDDRPICGMCVARRNAGDPLSPPCPSRRTVHRPTRRDPDPDA